jgi:3',5'-cyclic AMP phosphodiesterase CpdA
MRTMPLHLVPISRRRFLAASLAAGAAVLGARTTGAEQRAADADRWVLTADPHIAADRDLVHLDTRMADNLARIVAAVADLEPRPAGLLLDGDAAYNKGEPGDYRLLAELLRPLADAGLPVHITLGNHDDRENFRAGLARAAAGSPLVSRHVAVVEANRANWFLLDSLDRVNATPGTLGEEQVAWLARALDARPGKPALVVVHHNPLWTLPADKRPGLVDTERLFGVLVPRKQVKAVFFGHTHRWQRDRHEGIHLVNLPPVGYVFAKDQPSGWVDVRLRPGAAVLALHALNPQHPQNRETVELAWRS